MVTFTPTPTISTSKGCCTKCSDVYCRALPPPPWHTASLTRNLSTSLNLSALFDLDLSTDLAVCVRVCVDLCAGVCVDLALHPDTTSHGSSQPTRATTRRAALDGASRNSATAPASHAGAAPAPRKGKWLPEQSGSGWRTDCWTDATIDPASPTRVRRCSARCRCTRTMHARATGEAPISSATVSPCEVSSIAVGSAEANADPSCS